MMFSRQRKNHKILILGPQSSGKTTIMYRLAEQPVPEVMVPTAVFALEKTVETPDGHKFTFSEQKQESLGASAIVFVISKSTLEDGFEALKLFLNTSPQQDIPLLILINKEDTEDCSNAESLCSEITPTIGVSRSWAVLNCSGRNNLGMSVVISWLQTKLPIS